MDFVERLQRRDQSWWAARARLTDPRTLRRSLHLRRDLAHRRYADEPESRWRCCDAWPRKLLHKWNSREFCVRHGCAVPALYAYAASAREVPFDELPDRYVIRPVLGFARHGTLVMAAGFELLSERRFTNAELVEQLASERGAGRGPFLVEEVIERDDRSGRLPIEFKCHTFGPEVAAVQVTEREHGRTGGAVSRYYTSDWLPFDDRMDEALPLAELSERPAFLEELVETAARLGAAIATYMRIDFFGSARGPVFNEFSSVPAKNDPRFTQYCRDLFGAIWNERFPNAV